MMNEILQNSGNSSRRNRGRLVLVLLMAGGVLAATACDKGTSETPVAQAPINAIPTAPAENLNADRYQLGGPAKAITVGESSAIALTIEAADGLKVNEEFPWSITFEDAPGVEIAKKEFKMEELDLEPRRASIPLTVSASESGKHLLSAVGNFSVCNDTQCYVIRNQKLAFHVEASGGDDAPAAGAN